MKLHARGVAVSTAALASGLAASIDQIQPALVVEKVTQIMTTTIRTTTTTVTTIFNQASDSKVLDYMASQFLAGMQPVTGLIDNVLGGPVGVNNIDQSRVIVDWAVNYNASPTPASVSALSYYYAYLHNYLGSVNATVPSPSLQFITQTGPQVVSAYPNLGAQVLVAVGAIVAVIGCIALIRKIRQVKRDSDKADTQLDLPNG